MFMASVLSLNEIKQACCEDAMNFLECNLKLEELAKQNYIKRARSNFAIGQVAQLVEQRTENPCVGGSIPPLSTKQKDFRGLVLPFSLTFMSLGDFTERFTEHFVYHDIRAISKSSKLESPSIETLQKSALAFQIS